jgi:Phage Mu protein F like protein
MPDLTRGTQTLAGQLRSLELRLGNKLPTKSWRDLKHNQHDRAFVVAGAMKADLLNDFANAVSTAIKDGKGLDWFQKQFDDIVKKHGWEFNGDRQWRARVIYQTNMRVSYAAGRQAQMRNPELLKLKPYKMYRHSGSENPRLQHKAWDKLCLRADHPAWERMSAPNGWGCDCREVLVSKRDIERMGGRLSENMPVGIDTIPEEWAYSPGADVMDELGKIVETKAVALPPELHNEIKETVANVKASRAAIKEVVKLGKASLTDKEFTVIINGGVRKELVNGIADRTDFSTAQLKSMRDGITVHNHPNGSSFSVSDYLIAKQQRTRIIAAGHDGEVYTAHVLDNEITFELLTIESRAEKLLESQPVSERGRWLTHLMARMLAKKGVLHYSFNIVEPRWLTELIAKT